MMGFELLAELDDGGGAFFAKLGYGGQFDFRGDVRIDPVGQLTGRRGLRGGRFIDGCGIESKAEGQDRDEDSQQHHDAAALGGRGEQGLDLSLPLVELLAHFLKAEEGGLGLEHVIEQSAGG